jgi:glutamate-1-semialdehyde aminotransferase
LNDRLKPNPQRLVELRTREAEEFRRRTPNSAALRQRASRHLPNGVPMTWMAGLYRTPPIYVTSGSGPKFRDVDGHDYLDFNVCDLSMTMGYGNPIVAQALAAQADRGTHFLLPSESAVVSAELLAERVGLPYWQFVLSASGANLEVLRIARAKTGRRRLIVFGGHYHGHLDETLVREENGCTIPEYLGASAQASAATTVIPFNDLVALERELASKDVALVLTEPALTNCNVVLPQADFLAGVRELTSRYGTLLCFDEAHTFQFAFGGLTRAWHLRTDFVVLGKGLGTGVSFGLYGLSGELAEFYTRNSDVDIGPRGIATGGTTYGSALVTEVARTALERVLTPEAYSRVSSLGSLLADGLEGHFRRRSLPWCSFRLGPRAGWCLEPQLPQNGADAERSLDSDLIDTRRVFLANRGIWDAVASAGPQVSFVHSEADVDSYLATAGEFLDAIF